MPYLKCFIIQHSFIVTDHARNRNIEEWETLDSEIATDLYIKTDDDGLCEVRCVQNTLNNMYLACENIFSG